MYREYSGSSAPASPKTLILEIENILNMPLPFTTVECIREIEILTDRQRAVTNHLRELLHGSSQETKKKGEMPLVKNFDEMENHEINDQDRQSKTFGKQFSNRFSGAFSESAIDDSINKSEPCNKRQSLGSPQFINEESNPIIKPPIKPSIREVIQMTDQEAVDLCNPLIIALKMLQERHIQKKTIKHWIYNLANLFVTTDQDNNGYLEPEEYGEMISNLNLSADLKESLRSKFGEIDEDNTGKINLGEFLQYFLLFPKFNEEVLMNVHRNAPYSFDSRLTTLQRCRLWIYNTIEFPGHNTVSKILYCLDLILTMIPTICLFIEGVRLSYHIDWQWDEYFWIMSIFFAVQYVCGLLTCKSMKKFVKTHVSDLISFIFWILYRTILDPGLMNPMGFVVFRTIRLVKLNAIIDLKRLRQDLEIYKQTLQLVYTSYGAVTGILLFMIIFFSLLAYAFERGSYYEETGIWVRDENEGESPFSELYNCVYFTVVTMTTLGYGDMYPKSYVGKAVALMSACVGICNLTFMINIIGECFEEMFRKFLLEKSRKTDAEMALYIEKRISLTCSKYRLLQERSADITRHLIYSSSSRHSSPFRLTTREPGDIKLSSGTLEDVGVKDTLTEL